MARADETKPFVLDRIAGVVMALGFTILQLKYLWGIHDYSLRFPGSTSPWFLLDWFTVAFSLLSLAWSLTLAYGVFLGRRWGLWLNVLTTVEDLLSLASKNAHARITSEFTVLGVFNLILFLYCGLRLVGTFGPRFPRLLPVRDEALYSD